MLARDWYYHERSKTRRDFVESERAAICDIGQSPQDSEAHAYATLRALGVRPGWTVADIGCGAGVMACAAADLGAAVHAIDVSPSMLALAELRAREQKLKITTQSAGFLSFTYVPQSFDLIISEFALHHLPDFWKAVALTRIFNALKPGGMLFLRDVVFHEMPDGGERSVEQWTDFILGNRPFSRDDVAVHMRDEHSTFGWVLERLLADAKFASIRAHYEAPVYGVYHAMKPALAAVPAEASAG